MRIPGTSKHWIIALTLLLMIAGGFFYFNNKSEEKNARAGMKLVAVTLGDIEETVTAQGKLEPKKYVDVGAQVSGQIKKIYVDIGDDVKKGDLLAEIDPAVYESRVTADQAALKSLQAQLAEQKANAEFARQQYARNEKLIKAKAVAQETLEDTAAALKAANAKVQSLQAQIEQQQSGLKGDQANLSYTKIYAPMDGTVVTQPVREGQTLNANQTAPTVMQVANMNVMTVRAQAAEADVMRLKAGMEAYFTTLGGGEHKWRGTIRQVLPTPEIVNDVVLFDVLIDADNTDRQLMTSMTAQVFFSAGKAENVKIIPVRALGKRLKDQDSDAGQAYQVRVRGDDGGRPKERTVHVGLMTREAAEIRDGLSEGEKVVMFEPQAAGSAGSGQHRGGGPGARGPRL